MTEVIIQVGGEPKALQCDIAGAYNDLEFYAQYTDPRPLEQIAQDWGSNQTPILVKTSYGDQECGPYPVLTQLVRQSGKVCVNVRKEVL